MGIPLLRLYRSPIKFLFRIFYISTCSYLLLILGYKKDIKSIFLMPLNVSPFPLFHFLKNDIIFYPLFLIPLLRKYSKVTNFKNRIITLQHCFNSYRIYFRVYFIQSLSQFFFLQCLYSNYT